MGSLAPNAKPGAPTRRQSVGPVFPLTAINVGSDELLGGDRQGNRPSSTDALANRVLAKGEPISAPGGRADDFSWPRTSGVNIERARSRRPRQRVPPRCRCTRKRWPHHRRPPAPVRRCNGAHAVAISSLCRSSFTTCSDDAAPTPTRRPLTCGKPQSPGRSAQTFRPVSTCPVRLGICRVQGPTLSLRQL